MGRYRLIQFVTIPLQQQNFNLIHRVPAIRSLCEPPLTDEMSVALGLTRNIEFKDCGFVPDHGCRSE